MSEKNVLKDRIEYRNSNGKLHREDGPAVEYNDGTNVWFKNGLQHRIGGPAVEYANGTKEWYLNGRLHREDGPAIEFASGTIFYYLNGKLLSEEVFNKLSDDDKKHYKQPANESKLYTSITEFKQYNESMNEEEDLYHDIDWKDLELDMTQWFRRQPQKLDYDTFVKTFARTKEKILQYKMLN